MRRRLVGLGLGAWAGLAASHAAPQAAVAQASDPGGADAIRREAQLRELQELQLDTRLRADTSIPAGQRVLFDYGGFVTFNYLTLEDPDGETRVLRETDFIPYARLNIDGAHELFLRGRFGWRDFNDGDSFDGRGDEPVDGDLDRGYYRFDLQRYRAAYGDAGPGDLELSVQAGRDLAYWANGLVLGEVLDGAFVTVGTGPLSFDAVAGITPVRTVDFDTSRPNFDHNTRRGFFGGMLSLQAGDHRPFVYGLYQKDYNEDDFLDQGPIDTRYEYDSAYLGLGSTGALSDRLRYGVEVAYEFGDTLSNSFELSPAGGLIPVEQAEDDISAWALDVKLDYFPDDPLQTRLSAEAIAASGDADRGTTNTTFNGNRAGTTDTAFNGFGLLNTGLAFAPEVSNLLALRGGVAVFPLPDAGIFRRLQVGTDVFVYAKYDKDAPVDEPSGDERYLGWEPDVYVNWQLTSDLTLAARYGVFFPNDDNFASDDSRQFLFVGLTLGF
jgi:hypothetical protein